MASARCWTYQAMPWTQPVSVRAVAPSRTTTMSWPTAMWSSFGCSEPGSELAATRTSCPLVAVDGREPVGGQDLLPVPGIVTAGDQDREAPVFDLPVQVGDVVGDEVGRAEGTGRVGAREIEEGSRPVRARQAAHVAVVGG